MEDCFALFRKLDGEKDCSALTLINCKKCKFYRNDVKRSEIEKDIKAYQYGGGNKKKK